MQQVNVFGHVSGNLGLGVAARSLALAAQTRGYTVAALDLDPGHSRAAYATRLPFPLVKDARDLPVGINLVVLPPVSVAHSMIGRSALRTLMEDTASFNVLFTFWELPVVPLAWTSALELFDAVVAPSGYIESAMDSCLSGPQVIRGLTPLVMPAHVPTDRARFGLPADAFVAVASFDPLSDPMRKNPRAAIEAFRRAFTSSDKARLAIKLNAPADGYDDPELNRRVLKPLLDELRADERVIVIAETLPYEAVLSLYASADAYISLHRAEGLGLGLLEAMALGKPVVATGWSGNKVFMSPANSCLVRYKLVPVNATLPSYTTAMKGLQPLWAEPDVDDAALWLRRLASDLVLRDRVGAAAKAAFRRYQAEASMLEFLSDLESLMLQKEARQQVAPETPAQRLQRIRGVQRELRNAKLGPVERLTASALDQYRRHIGWRFVASGKGR